MQEEPGLTAATPAAASPLGAKEEGAKEEERVEDARFLFRRAGGTPAPRIMYKDIYIYIYI